MVCRHTKATIPRPGKVFLGGCMRSEAPAVCVSPRAPTPLSVALCAATGRHGRPSASLPVRPRPATVRLSPAAPWPISLLEADGSWLCLPAKWPKLRSSCASCYAPTRSTRRMPTCCAVGGSLSSLCVPSCCPRTDALFLRQAHREGQAHRGREPGLRRRQGDRAVALEALLLQAHRGLPPPHPQGASVVPCRSLGFLCVHSHAL